MGETVGGINTEPVRGLVGKPKQPPKWLAVCDDEKAAQELTGITDVFLKTFAPTAAKPMFRGEA
ncbi:hypothetical protein A2311_01490 [candidate division WOR-1 bacterium RIFOXYB2_FULL_48_7]|uniref:Uncharacterized protein n=1 Tax=candidate division WOR-1 bacterium RIFOXYB2_FULL_48_7 TaxID=1802583 RepID=A0A1F4TRF9_UNCSA|nr:MAG: hypothetical protein A2311_01490 [candidate division WOR-1 bacterium RIFOXYB2_FULL_48_7]